MVLKFPSGRVSVTIRDLQEHQRSQPGCNICRKRWNWGPSDCILGYLCVLHPCQHLVGSGCWRTVPEEQKHKCPVCNVTIECEESVLVLKAWEAVGLEVYKKMREEFDISWKQEMSVKENMKKELSPVDVASILYYVNLCDSLNFGRERIGIFLASGTEALTELHLDRLIFFLTHMPQHRDDSIERMIAIALHAHNISRGTNFGLSDLGMAVSSPKDLLEILRLAGTMRHIVKKVPRVLP